MAGLNVSKWQAATRPWNYTPAMQFFARMIARAEIDALAAQRFVCPYLADVSEAPKGELEIWDTAIMARDWIRRPAPEPRADREGYLASFDHCCDALGIDADAKRLEMLARIDAAVDFDCDEVWARIDYLAENPPDDNEAPLFTGMRVVPELDQMCMFSEVAA